MGWLSVVNVCKVSILIPIVFRLTLQTTHTKVVFDNFKGTQDGKAILNFHWDAAIIIVA